MSLSREDVVLGRALLAWGLVEEHYLHDCANDVRRLASQGRHATLGHMLVQRGFLSPDRYHAIVQALHQQYVEGSQVLPHMQQAVQDLPYLNQHGHYTRSLPRPSTLEESGIERAVDSWFDMAAQVTASGSNLENVKNEEPQPAAPRGKRKPADRAIRRKLKVPEHQERFPIGNWIAEEYLDAGNWGIVYRVTHAQSDRSQSFALKILKQLDASEEIKRRFVQEARTLAKLNHPGIVHVHDAGVMQGMLWFVMDFVPGPNLQEVITDAPLPLADALRVMQTLCKAVDYAHSMGVLHRDLKPDNVIMVDRLRPVLTDFGLAKDTTSSGMNLTQEGQRLGTPLYMAPELLLDAQGATKVSEVYSLGAMLYQCVCGEVPYFAKSLYDLADMISAGKFKPIRDTCPEAPKALEKLCKKALAQEPSKRFRTAGELGAELASLS